MAILIMMFFPHQDAISEEAAQKIDEMNEARHHVQQAEHMVPCIEFLLQYDKSLPFAVDNNGMNAFQFALSEGKRWTHDHLDEPLKLFSEWPTSSPCGFIFALDEMRANDNDEEPDEDSVLDTVFGMLRFNPAMFAHHVLK